MAFTEPRTTSWSRILLLDLLLLLLVSWTHGLTISYCSPDNNADSFSPVSSIYMSNGRCQDTCKSSYAFAVVQGQNCWCSDYVPGDQVNTYSCNQACPGYPNEWCGSTTKGLYAYFLMSGNTPSGTSGGTSSGASSTSESSSSSTSSSSPSTRPSSSPTTFSTLSSSASSAGAVPTQIYTSIMTVTGQVTTIVVTPTSNPDSALGQGSTISSGTGGGLSTGKVVGIVIGAALGLGLLVGLAVWFGLRRKHQKNVDISSEGSSFVATSGSGANSNIGVPSRQVSQMSSAGLLTRKSRLQNLGLSPGEDPRSVGAVGPNFDRRSLATDQRLNPYAIYSNEESTHSGVSLQDNQDYSRQLRVANPDT